LILVRRRGVNVKLLLLLPEFRAQLERISFLAFDLNARHSSTSSETGSLSYDNRLGL
jgi:hypothetical protein